MAGSRKRGTGGDSAAEQEMREQEVLRANREVAAYFRGRRTEREARAALKIIKAFVRDREKLSPKDRRPLPGAGSSRTAKRTPTRKIDDHVERRRRRSPRPKKPVIGPRAVEAVAESPEGHLDGEATSLRTEST